jgi:signal transduction histidine kinase
VEVTGTPCIYRGQPCAQVICRDVTRRRRAERALRQAKAELEERVRERTEELSRKNAELQHKQRLMEQALAAQERDRKLVAYEIHDTILQDVIGAVMFLDTVYEDKAAAARKIAEPLEHARKLLRNCIDGARRMISGLRPLIIDEQGIQGAIEYLANEFKSRGVEVQFSHSMKSRRLAPDLENAVFRIVQEALANVERHSGSGAGDVDITESDGHLRLEVRDRGVGFDPQAVGEGHFGLEGVKERAQLAGGSATIKSSPGMGTTVVVVLPIAPRRG